MYQHYLSVDRRRTLHVTFAAMPLSLPAPGGFNCGVVNAVVVCFVDGAVIVVDMGHDSRRRRRKSLVRLGVVVEVN
jgi:hypothetical protein